MALISATTWGFGFLQYCFEQENVFYDEFCKNETKDLVLPNRLCPWEQALGVSENMSPW